MPDNETARALLGVVVFLGIGWLLSENRRALPWRPVLVGLACQVALALLLTQIPAVTAAFAAATHAVDALQAASRAGSSFMFGYLGGGRAPFSVEDPGAAFIFAFQALPAILLVGALSALLWHWKVLIWIVRAASWPWRSTISAGAWPRPRASQRPKPPSATPRRSPAAGRCSAITHVRP